MAKKETAAAPKHLPSHGVYVIEGEGEKAFWTKIGAAWAHSDGNGYNVTLTALPIGGRLVIRNRKEPGNDPRLLLSELLANGAETAGGREIDPKPVVKIFDPNGSATWLLTEVSPADPKSAFGLCDLGMGCPELGYVDISELAAVRTRFGLRLEIDRHFRPAKTLSEYAAEARRHGRIVA